MSVERMRGQLDDQIWTKQSLKDTLMISSVFCRFSKIGPDKKTNEFALWSYQQFIVLHAS